MKIKVTAVVITELYHEDFVVRAEFLDGFLNRPQFAGGSKVSMDGAYGKK